MHTCIRMQRSSGWSVDRPVYLHTMRGSVETSIHQWIIRDWCTEMQLPYMIKGPSVLVLTLGDCMPLLPPASTGYFASVGSSTMTSTQLTDACWPCGTQPRSSTTATPGPNASCQFALPCSRFVFGWLLAFNSSRRSPPTTDDGDSKRPQAGMCPRAGVCGIPCDICP